MKRTSLIATLFVILIFISPVLAESTTLKITSKVNPKFIIEEIKEKPYILYFTVGKLYFKANNLEKSQEMFQKAINLNNDFAQAHYNLAVVYYENKEYDKALEKLKETISLDSSYSRAYNSLGVLYFELGEINNAIESFSKTVELEPNNINASFDLAQSYVARFRKAELTSTQDYDDLDKALLYLKKTEELQPDFPNALNNIEIIESILK